MQSEEPAASSQLLIHRFPVGLAVGNDFCSLKQAAVDIYTEIHGANYVLMLWRVKSGGGLKGKKVTLDYKNSKPIVPDLVL